MTGNARTILWQSWWQELSTPRRMMHFSMWCPARRRGLPFVKIDELLLASDAVDTHGSLLQQDGKNDLIVGVKPLE